MTALLNAQCDAEKKQSPPKVRHSLTNCCALRCGC